MSRSACAIGKDYVVASFKGVQFYCTTAEAEGGRRGAEGEFPFGEDTAYADLGRKIRVYKLTAAFREDDHVSDSHALFMACESPGPGLLVHPTRGAFTAACRSVKLTDKIEEAAGETTADLEFVEANLFFGGFAGSLFGIIATGLFVASRDAFVEDYHPVRVAQPWRTDVIDTAQTLVTATTTAMVQVLTPDSSPTLWRDSLKMKTIAQDNALAVDSKNVEWALSTGFMSISTVVVDPTAKFNIMRRLANVATKSSTVPSGTAMESEEAVLSRHRVLAAIGMAEAAMGRTYSHLDEGLAAMDTVLAVLDDEAQAAYDDCDNVLFIELRKYATEFSKMMNDLSYRLPGLIAVDFMGGIYPLVAAYAIYNDATRHRELEARASNIVDANGRFAPIVRGVTPI